MRNKFIMGSIFCLTMLGSISTSWAMGHFQDHGPDASSYTGSITYHISTVDYINADKLYGEMITNDGNVIVTSSPQKNAINSHKITIKNSQRLYLAHVISGEKEGKIKDEVYRFSNILRLVVFTPKTPNEIRRFHNHDASYIFYKTVRLTPYDVQFRGYTAEEKQELVNFSNSYKSDLKLPVDLIKKQDLVEAHKKIIATGTGSGKVRTSRQNSSVVPKLESIFKEYGYTITSSKANEAVMAEKKGESDYIFIVGAHMDTVPRGSGGPTMGADDDGGGSAIVLEIARKLAKKNLTHGIRFYLFDNEEIGLVGSGKIARQVNKRKVKGMLQLEMPLYKHSTGMVVTCRGKPNADQTLNFDLKKDLAAAVKQVGLGVHHYCTSASDHSPFWNAGVPAAVVSEYFDGRRNPHYHKPSDKINARGYDNDYFNKIANAAFAVVSKIVKPK